jgi:hypothetical protein
VLVVLRLSPWSRFAIGAVNVGSAAITRNRRRQSLCSWTQRILVSFGGLRGLLVRVVLAVVHPRLMWGRGVDWSRHWQWWHIVSVQSKIFSEPSIGHWHEQSRTCLHNETGSSQGTELTSQEHCVVESRGGQVVKIEGIRTATTYATPLILPSVDVCHL